MNKKLYYKNYYIKNKDEILKKRKIYNNKIKNILKIRNRKNYNKNKNKKCNYCQICNYQATSNQNYIIHNDRMPHLKKIIEFLNNYSENKLKFILKFI